MNFRFIAKKISTEHVDRYIMLLDVYNIVTFSLQ
jgi:hypothetical protein